MTMRAPIAASDSAAARPMPEVAPVMTQVLPAMLGRDSVGSVSSAWRMN